ncbi:MAG: alpha/beta hydrolase [Thermoleophilaceae bacterium]
MPKPIDRTIEAGGIGTHYLEAGSGRPVVLLHSGEFGGSARLSWELVIRGFAVHYRVLAPDWLGYGETEKLYDFSRRGARRIDHIGDFLAALGIEEAAFVGNSMGGSILARVAASNSPVWPISAIVLISGGGFVPDNPERQTLLDYDCTVDGMRRMLEVLFRDPRWAADEEYVRRRYESSIVPGAWECAAAARLRSPFLGPQREFGQPDTTEYELISVPTLLVAGANDVLRLPGYADELQARIRGSRLHTYEDCGHMPNIEQAPRLETDVLDFLLEVYPPTSA